MLAVVVLAAGMVIADMAKHTQVRPSGVNMVNGGLVYTIDSSATRQFIDTLSSDTVGLDLSLKSLSLAYELTGFTFCDSCNDSVILITQAITSMNGHAPRIIFTDTFGTDGALDSTEIVRKNFYADTLLYNKLYFRTIIKDTVLEFSADEDQTTTIRAMYHVWERY